MLKTLPETPERIRQELTLLIALGGPLIATKSSAAHEVEQVYARAYELCQQVGETPQLFPALRGLWDHYLDRGELQRAHELGKQLLSLAQREQAPTVLVSARRALGTTLLYMGELPSALEHLEQGIAIYDPHQHHSLAFIYGQDPGLVCRIHAALTLWYLGYPDQALKNMHKVLTLAHELSHSHSLAFVLIFASALHQFRREAQAAQEKAEAAITISTEQGFPQRLAQGTISRGWAMVEQGQLEEGIEQIRQGLAASQAGEMRLGNAAFLGVLAEAHGKAGKIEEGLEAVAEASEAVAGTGARVHEAWLYLIKGDLLRRKAEGERQTAKVEAEAEACFLQALEISRRQSAKSLELRATVSLSRLWQKQGKGEEARGMLAEIYGWFTEGFDTPDLKEAKTLLEGLS